ncbi:hypothetical protein Hokovirus_3_288 [Hokovirus HKV1]|uniref:Tetratricopeptide repeat protein n=1 Tax=Hokovirus HKV1 TaxID=1977638 RepID=A0A1V0SH13_9VIRU|nr:hypothetical protein Hokovirus_3_288 [Hokovirus HKV1]
MVINGIESLTKQDIRIKHLLKNNSIDHDNKKILKKISRKSRKKKFFTRYKPKWLFCCTNFNILYKKYYETQNYELAIQFLELELTCYINYFYDDLQNNFRLYDITLYYYKLINLHYILNNIPEVIRYYNILIDIFNFSNNYNNVAITYETLATIDPNNQYNYYYHALIFYDKAKNIPHIYDNMIKLGNLSVNYQEFKTALFFYNSALNLDFHMNKSSLIFLIILCSLCDNNYIFAQNFYNDNVKNIKNINISNHCRNTLDNYSILNVNYVNYLINYYSQRTNKNINTIRIILLQNIKINTLTYIYNNNNNNYK